MKISEFINSLLEKNDKALIIVKKWIFWICIDENAFFMSKFFNMKLTILDKQSIKIGFPDNVKEKWLNNLVENNISYITFEKVNNIFEEKEKYIDKNFLKIYRVDLEDYKFTKEKILWLKKIWIEAKNEKNFLLKDKLENIYLTLLDLLFRLPKKERYFLREKIEKIFLDLFELIYEYMYNLWDRKILIKEIFKKVMILREFTRFLYKMWKIKNDNIFLNLGDDWIEILKICKGIMNKK